MRLGLFGIACTPPGRLPGSTIRYSAPEPPKDLPEWEKYWWISDNKKDPDYLSSGRLALRIKTENLGVRSTWLDGKCQRVENCLNFFIVHLHLTAEAIKEDRAAEETDFSFQERMPVESRLIWMEDYAEKLHPLTSPSCHVPRWAKEADVVARRC